MHKDIETAVLLFNDDGSLSKIVEILNSYHLPYIVIREKEKNKIMAEWWENRTVPKSRKDIREMLKKENIDSTGNWLLDNLALSLSDCYWVKPYSACPALQWSDVNLYDNYFEPVKIGGIPVEHADPVKKEKVRYSPDASTGGELPKWWYI